MILPGSAVLGILHSRFSPLDLSVDQDHWMGRRPMKRRLQNLFCLSCVKLYC